MRGSMSPCGPRRLSPRAAMRLRASAARPVPPSSLAPRAQCSRSEENAPRGTTSSGDRRRRCTQAALGLQQRRWSSCKASLPSRCSDSGRSSALSAPPGSRPLELPPPPPSAFSTAIRAVPCNRILYSPPVLHFPPSPAKFLARALVLQPHLPPVVILSGVKRSEESSRQGCSACSTARFFVALLLRMTSAVVVLAHPSQAPGRCVRRSRRRPLRARVEERRRRRGMRCPLGSFIDA